MSSEFQSSSELMITENCLPLTDEVTDENPVCSISLKPSKILNL